jgi:hypothetical protein
MTKKELWDLQSPEERRSSLSNLMINVTLQKVNPCTFLKTKIGFRYNIDGKSYIVFKIQFDEKRNITYTFSKHI